MARNKYVKDYRLVESVDERGRIRVESEYIGRYYVFRADAPTISAEKKRLGALCAVSWLTYIGAMIPISAAMRTYYISLPFVLAALPLGMLSASVAALPTDGSPMVHSTADKIANSLPPRALFAALLSALAFAAQLVRLAFTRKGLWPGDGIFCLGAAVTAFCGWRIFSRRKNLALCETEEKP